MEATADAIKTTIKWEKLPGNQSQSPDNFGEQPGKFVHSE